MNCTPTILANNVGYARFLTPQQFHQNILPWGTNLTQLLVCFGMRKEAEPPKNLLTTSGDNNIKVLESLTNTNIQIKQKSRTASGEK